MRRMTKKPVAIIVAAFMLIAAAAGAYAYWTSGGTGTGTAGTGTSEDIAVHQTSTVTDMGPGVAAQPLSGNFTNETDSAVYVSTVTAEVTGTDADGCTAADYTIVNAESTVNAEVPMSDGTARVGSWGGSDTPTIAFNSTNVNQDACQGATVTIEYTIA